MTDGPDGDAEETDHGAYARALARIIRGDGKSWVVFEQGTVVVFTSPALGADLRADAIALLKEHGPVRPGSPGGDFSVVTLPDELGWAVAFDHPDLLTLVLRDEIGDEPKEISVGLYGRAKRGQDADALRIVHVEDARTGEP